MTNPLTAFAIPGSFTGAKNRTLPIRYTDEINVADFGAVSDPTGMIDNLPAFIAAIKAARSAAMIAGAISIGHVDADVKAIGVVYVPRGVYFVSDTIPLMPGLSSGYGNSITFRGENSEATVIFGNHNGFVLNTGYSAGMTGGFIIEGVTVRNDNRTPYSSGCIYNGGMVSTTRNCIIGPGMVGLAVQSITCWSGGVSDCTFIGPGMGINSLGLSQSTDGSMVNGCHFTNWDTAHIVAQDTAAVKGCSYHKCGIGIDVGGRAGPGNFFTSPSNSFGVGIVSGFSIQGCRFKSCGTAIGNASGNGGSGTISGIDIDCTPAAGISMSGNVQYGINLIMGGMIAACLVHGGPIDQFAYAMPYIGPFANNLECIGLLCGDDVPYAKRWSVGNGFCAARAVSFNNNGCDRTPDWTFSDLNWSELGDAFILGTTLSFDTYPVRNGMYLYQYVLKWILGPGVTPGTQAVKQGTFFSGGLHPAVLDSGDGTGAAGNVITFDHTNLTGPALIAGGIIQMQGSVGDYNDSITIDDGSGLLVTAGNVANFSTASATLNGATISDSSGGSGNILAFSSVTNPGNFMSPGSRVAIGINGAGGIPRDTWLVDQIDATHWHINRNLAITTPTTIYVRPDIRPGYKIATIAPIDTLNRTPPFGAKLVTEVSLTQWTLDTSALYGPPQGPVPFVIEEDNVFQRTLVAQINADQWSFDGAPTNIGANLQAWISSAWAVDKSQSTGAPTTFTFFLDNPGNKYRITDSPIAAWTGSVSNVGKVVAVGGGSNEVLIRFDENLGYVIAG